MSSAICSQPLTYSIPPSGDAHGAPLMLMEPHSCLLSPAHAHGTARTVLSPVRTWGEQRVRKPITPWNASATCRATASSKRAQGTGRSQGGCHRRTATAGPCVALLIRVVAACLFVSLSHQRFSRTNIGRTTGRSGRSRRRIAIQSARTCQTASPTTPITIL